MGRPNMERYPGEYDDLANQPAVLLRDTPEDRERLGKAILRARFGAVWNLVEDPQNARLIEEHLAEVKKEADAILAALRYE